MRTTPILCTLLAAIPGLLAAQPPAVQSQDPSHAQLTEIQVRPQASVDIRVLAADIGLTVGEAQMVFGARTTHMEYMTSYERAQRRAIDALGTERYNELMAGHTIRLNNGQPFRLANR